MPSDFAASLFLPKLLMCAVEQKMPNVSHLRKSLRRGPFPLPPFLSQSESGIVKKWNVLMPFRSPPAPVGTSYPRGMLRCPSTCADW